MQKTTVNPARNLRHWICELRFSASWLWLLPPLINIILLVTVRRGLIYNDPSLTHVVGPLILVQYSDAVRSQLEIFLPLTGLFLFPNLLASEWMQGTLALIAVRKSLFSIMFVRFFWVSLYLFALLIVTLLIGFLIGNYVPDHGQPLQWMIDAVVVIFPPVFFLGAFSLLVTVLTLSRVTGFVLTSAFWLVMYTIVHLYLFFGSPKYAWVPFTPFGWTYEKYALGPANWFIGKMTYLLLFVVMMSVLWFPLREEARYIRNLEE